MKTIVNYNGETVGSVVHAFEHAGFGKAPFRFTGCTENWFKVAPDDPGKPGGSCDYCGASIRWEFHVISADGKRHKVGSDCIGKAGDEGLRKVVDAKVRQIKRDATHARQDALIAKGKTAFARPEVLAYLQSAPHPYRDRAARGETKASMVAWYFANAGRSGCYYMAKMVLRVAANLVQVAA